MSGDLLALLAAIGLLAANAFFVGAEFALISARRDRLEAMAEAGVGGARTVLRAGADLSRMLAASQLGITISSLLLGRLGEPAVAHLLERPLEWAGLPEAVLHPLAFAVSLAIVVVAHILLGEMVPKNIAIAGPERTAIWLVPPFLVWTTVARPLIELFNVMANGVLRLIGVEPRDELETSFTPVELADLIAESGREGLLDQDESRRLARTISSVESTVAEVVVPLDELITLPEQPTVADVAGAVARTGFSRFPLRAADGRLTGYLHVKDVLDLLDMGSDATEPRVVPTERVRGLPEVAMPTRLDEALALLRQARAHLGRVVDPRGRTVGLVTLEDLMERYVGEVRDATHATPAPDPRPADRP